MLRASEFVLNFILNSFWQIAVIFTIASVGAWLLKNGPARYRHALWIVGLTACLVVPLLTATHFVPAWVSSFQFAAPTAPANSVATDASLEDLKVRDERALTRLVAALADDNWRVRQLAVWALSEMKDERAVTALCIVLLSDVRIEVRRSAAEALGEIANVAAIPSLKQALNDADSSVSAKAAWAISEIEG